MAELIPGQAAKIRDKALTLLLRRKANLNNRPRREALKAAAPMVTAEVIYRLGPSSVLERLAQYRPPSGGTITDWHLYQSRITQFLEDKDVKAWVENVATEIEAIAERGNAHAN